MILTFHVRETLNQWSAFEQWDVVYVLDLDRIGGLSLDDEALGSKLDGS